VCVCVCGGGARVFFPPSKSVSTFLDRGCRVVSATDPHCRTLSFLHWSRYYFFKVAPQLVVILAGTSLGHMVIVMVYGTGRLRVRLKVCGDQDAG
jgi:hypothetical protein